MENNEKNEGLLSAHLSMATYIVGLLKSLKVENDLETDKWSIKCVKNWGKKYAYNQILGRVNTKIKKLGGRQIQVKD